MAYSKAILLDAKEDEGRDNVSSSIRGKIMRRLNNNSDKVFAYISRLRRQMDSFIYTSQRFRIAQSF
jgi:hypothetical protein